MAITSSSITNQSPRSELNLSYSTSVFPSARASFTSTPCDNSPVAQSLLPGFGNLGLRMSSLDTLLGVTPFVYTSANSNLNSTPVHIPASISTSYSHPNSAASFCSSGSFSSMLSFSSMGSFQTSPNAYGPLNLSSTSTLYSTAQSNSNFFYPSSSSFSCWPSCTASPISTLPSRDNSFHAPLTTMNQLIVYSYLLVSRLCVLVNACVCTFQF